MENFRITIDQGLTGNDQTKQEFRVVVQKNRKLTEQDKGAIIEATLYKISGSFVPEASYIFEAIDLHNNPIHAKIDADQLESAVAFFFNSILNTEYFVRSVPQCSSLNEGYRNRIFSDLNSGYADRAS